MEEEVREILRTAVGAAPPVKGNLAERIRQRFAPFGGVELKLPRRDAIRKPPDFTQD
jgi:plasmid stability protein